MLSAHSLAMPWHFSRVLAVLRRAARSPQHVPQPLQRVGLIQPLGLAVGELTIAPLGRRLQRLHVRASGAAPNASSLVTANANRPRPTSAKANVWRKRQARRWIPDQSR